MQYRFSDSPILLFCLVKAAKAQLVPLYAYDSRFPNVLYLRDTGSDTRDNSSYAQQGLQGNGRSSGVYQFSRLAGQLFPFCQ